MPNGAESPDGRSPQARGYVIASRVTSIGMQMALPPAIGWWVDRQLNTAPCFVVVGAVFGFVVALLELVRFAKENTGSKR
jgi:F0F1-type ATP synthase assembly protein I